MSRFRTPARLLAVALVALVVLVAPTTASAAPPVPTGVSAIAGDGSVTLSWQPVSGATYYRVYRGTSPNSITTLVSPSTLSATSFTASASNGQTYYYAVRSYALVGGESANSLPVAATARARSCSSGNPVVVENCFPGTEAWKVDPPAQVSNGGIEGFATQTSIDNGSSVGLKVNTKDGAPYRIEIYRTGWYGGAQGRLISVLHGLTGVDQPGCMEDADTGLVDCSNWSTSATLTTTSAWPSGVYLLRLVREDTGGENHILLTIRSDGTSPDLVYGVPVSTYQAYNRWGGKSLYDFNSTGPNTVAGTPRAVKVSFDRPYLPDRDSYQMADVQAVGWFERQGYDISYVTSVDLHAGTGPVPARAYVLGVHDEYWSSQMRTRMEQARGVGKGLFWLGANSVYWRIRYEASPVSGASNRVEVSYKSTQSGPPDPSGHATGTWRDPAGANDPENALVGIYYIGDDNFGAYPLMVSPEEGKHRIWRYTTLASLDQAAQLGSGLVGWEWDARVQNGAEPPGVETVATSPVQGSILQDAGRDYAPGSALVHAAYYRAASSAVVFATGTNNWSRGLGRNMEGQGEPLAAIMQATANALQDMGARPATPSAEVSLDATGPLAIASRTPAPGATGVSPENDVTITFDRPLDPSTVSGGFTLRGPGSTEVPADVSYDAASRTVTIDPETQLDAFTNYTVTVGAGVHGWNGQGLSGSGSWSFTTGPGLPPAVTSRAPAPGATGIALDATVSATFDRHLDPSTISAGFRIEGPGGGTVSATADYDSATRRARLTPNLLLSPGTTYTARITTALKAADGTPVAQGETWTFTTAPALEVESRTPAPLATGVSSDTVVRVRFSRDANPATIDSDSFTLTGPSGAVPASVTYDGTTRTATLTPAAPLANLATYEASLADSIRAADGAPLIATSWTFQTAAVDPPPPAAVGLTPAAGQQNVPLGTTVRATFDTALDPDSLTTQSFRLEGPGGTPVAATIDYESATRTAVLTPAVSLADASTYTARLTTAVRSAAGEPLSSEVSWSFSTESCPCSLMGNSTPASTGNPVQDGRPGSGPFTYELGTKFRVDREMALGAIRFYKSPGETGTHTGRLWSADGTQIATVTFTDETASGWQRQALSQPVELDPGETYIVSVSLNSRYVLTAAGLANQLANGPLRSVADGQNGVFGLSAGDFPTNSWNSSNYFVDPVVHDPQAPPQPPQVSAQSPLAGATGVDRSADVTATFDSAVDPATVNGQTFTLDGPGGTSVSGTVSYDAGSRTATFDPDNLLALGATYTARLGTGIQSPAGVGLAAPVTWSFTISQGDAPTVVARMPAAGSTNASPVLPVRVTFAEALDPATVTAANVTLEGPGGPVAATVDYDADSFTVILTPNAPLSAATAYTVQLGTGLKSSAGVPLAAPQSYGFTTSSCPCRLYGDTDAPQAVGLPTQDGRGGPGPWSYELGTKIEVTDPARLEAIRFYKSAGETGTHVGRVWTAGGTLLASVTFQDETASAWQEQALDTPVELAPGQTYVVSVGFNDLFVMTGAGLANVIDDGPLRSVADGANGVFGSSAGTFPTSSWNSSSYFVDAVVR